MLWWFASTCRHLGIGGTSPKPAVVEAQKQAMKRYRKLDRFYKRGEFYGLNEEIHVHALADEGAFVVNAFNLSDQSRVIRGEAILARLGLDSNRPYTGDDSLGEVKGGRYRIAVELPPWSARVGYFRPNANKTGATSGLPRIDAADPALAANEPARRAKLD